MTAANLCRHKCAISGGYLPPSKEANKSPLHPALRFSHRWNMQASIDLLWTHLEASPRASNPSLIQCLSLIIRSTAGHVHHDDLKDALTLSETSLTISPLLWALILLLTHSSCLSQGFNNGEEKPTFSFKRRGCWEALLAMAAPEATIYQYDWQPPSPFIKQVE